MELPDGTPLMHGNSVYDPKKAHEYYLRTRKLKGRQKGQAAPPPKQNSSKGKEVENFLNKLPMSAAGFKTQEIASFVKEAVKKTDDEVKADIENLNKHLTVQNAAKAATLDVLLRNRSAKPAAEKPAKKAPPKKDPQILKRQKQHAARRVASIRSELADLNRKLKDAMAEARKSEAKKKRGPTRAEKTKAAKEAKKYRDKHKQKLANKRKGAASKSKASGKPKADTVTSLKNKIDETRGRLDKAIQAQKALG